MTVRDTHPEIERARAAGVTPLLHIVACGKAKTTTPQAARDLYTGDLTRKHLAWVATRTGEFTDDAPVLIASAKHGLVDPDTTIAPYDETLNDLDADALNAWVELVTAQLAERGLVGCRLAVYGGATYRTALARVGRVHEGLGGGMIGERKHALRKMLDYTANWIAA